jgi:hypothetical protein
MHLKRPNYIFQSFPLRSPLPNCIAENFFAHGGKHVASDPLQERVLTAEAPSLKEINTGALLQKYRSLKTSQIYYKRVTKRCLSSAGPMIKARDGPERGRQLPLEEYSPLADRSPLATQPL